jgi:3-hydroxyisobutyrate dehydrogenase-like beta-hydroxyacid dehydrogenase
METSTLTLKDKMAARDILLAGGIRMIDAPLSGTGAQAKTKDLSIYSSGDVKDVKSFSAIFMASRAQTTTWVSLAMA